jgi:hypothetical protein
MHTRLNMMLIGLVIVFMLSGCGVQASGQPLTYRSLAQDSILRSDPKDETPVIRIIANGQEIDQLIHQFGDPPPLQLAPQLVEQLRQLDYTHSFAVLVTQGQTGPRSFRVTVQQITRQNDQVTVQAEFVGPKPGEGQPMVVLDPYHLVAIIKDGVWGRQVQFDLIAEGKVVAKTAHFIP